MARIFIPQLGDTELKRNRAGYWSIHWTIPAEFGEDGKARTRTYSCRTKDRRVAEDVRQAWLTAQHQIAAAGPGGVIIQDILGWYETGHLDAQDRTPGQKFALKPIALELGQLELPDLTPSRVREYTEARRKLGRKDGTIRRELGALRAAIGWCIKSGHLPSDTPIPFLPLPAASEGRLNTLDEADEAKLFNHARNMVMTLDPSLPQWRAALFVCIALAAPARSTAIQTLTWDRVTFPAGNHPGLIDYRQAGTRRTKKRRVAVPISDRLLPVMQAAWSLRKNEYVLGGTGSVRRSFATLVQNAGVKRVTRHDLRRTWASLAAGRDVDLYKIAAVLGDTYQTTEKNYAHLSPSHLVGAVNP